MGDILKEAIADAKAVRETALANAKMALEEAFTPQLKSMLSAKLREDDEFEGEEEVPAEDEIGDEEAFEEDEEFGGEEEVPEEEPEVEEEGIIEIDGVKYAPIVSEDEEEFGDDEEEVEEDLDLESVIKELESELSEEDETGETAVDEADETEGEEVNEDEEIEIDESLFLEEDDEDEDEEEVEESVENTDNYDEIKSELNQYKEAVEFMKNKLHEVNILNAKLLFTNKLFREYSLDNGQKLKVVETFDRAQTTREIKLVYSTLAEQFGDNTTITRKNNIKESASSVIGSTKSSKQSRKVITEEEETANRFRKLAGIING
jgi:hypothetical protein